MRRLIGATRFFTLIPVVCVFIAATLLLFYGAAETFIVIVNAFTHSVDSKGAKTLLLSFIEIVDLFLLSTVLYIISLGLYELFIDDKIEIPDWLVIHNLDDLKNNLISVVIVVLGVLFLGQVISWDGQSNLLSPGLAISVVIFALSYFLSLKKGK
jgi:Predicted membrane protein